MRLEVFSLFNFNPENLPRLWLLFGQKDETKKETCYDDVVLAVTVKVPGTCSVGPVGQGRVTAEGVGACQLFLPLFLQSLYFRDS